MALSNRPKRAAAPAEITQELEAWKAAEVRAESAERRLRTYMEDWAEDNPKLAALQGEVAASQRSLSGAREAIKKAAKLHQVSADSDGFKVSFSMPMTDTYSAQMLVDVPGVAKIPGLIKSWKVNQAAVRAAVAAGVVPDLSEYHERRPTTTAGMVRLSVPKPG